MPPQWEQAISEARIKSTFYDEGSQNLVIDVFQYGRDVASARRGLFMLSVGTVLSFPLTTLPSTTPIALVPNTAHLDLRQCIKYILELSGNRLLFIDDTSWLSSVDLEVRTMASARRGCTRHFFVPNEFVGRESENLPIISPKNDVVFAVEGELAIVRNGLKFRNFTRFRRE